MSDEGGRSLWHRLPVSERAGSVLDWRGGNCYEVWGPSHKGPGQELQGVVDIRQRVYQTGGEYRHFYFRLANVLSMGLEVWMQVQKDVEWVELIDHELNRCYRVRSNVFRERGLIYWAGIGPRCGVEPEVWTVSSSPLGEPDRGWPSLRGGVTR